MKKALLPQLQHQDLHIPLTVTSRIKILTLQLQVISLSYEFKKYVKASTVDKHKLENMLSPIT